MYLGFFSGLSDPLLVFIEQLGLLFWLEAGDLSKAPSEKDEGVPKLRTNEEKFILDWDIPKFKRGFKGLAAPELTFGGCEVVIVFFGVAASPVEKRSSSSKSQSSGS